MPVEIRELVIRTSVNSEKEDEKKQLEKEDPCCSDENLEKLEMLKQFTDQLKKQKER